MIKIIKTYKNNKKYKGTLYHFRYQASKETLLFLTIKYFLIIIFLFSFFLIFLY